MPWHFCDLTGTPEQLLVWHTIFLMSPPNFSGNQAVQFFLTVVSSACFALICLIGFFLITGMLVILRYDEFMCVCIVRLSIIMYCIEMVCTVLCRKVWFGNVLSHNTVTFSKCAAWSTFCRSVCWSSIVQMFWFACLCTYFFVCLIILVDSLLLGATNFSCIISKFT